MMNMYLEKRKETSRRHLLFTVPNVVAVAPQMRLVEVCFSMIRKWVCGKQLELSVLLLTKAFTATMSSSIDVLSAILNRSLEANFRPSPHVQ